MGLETSGTQCHIRDGVGEVRLSTGRPCNALDGAAIRRLRECLDEARSDARCRVVTLTTAHADFCTGFDFEYGASADSEALARTGRDFWECMESIATMPKPVVAGLRGKVMGGGVGLAAACDVVLASPDVKLQLPEVLVGMMPILVAPFLLRRVSPVRLRYLAFGTRDVSAVEARELGLVDEVAARDVTMAVAQQTVRVLRSAAHAITTFKRILGDWERAEFESRKQQALAAAEEWLHRPETSASMKDLAEGFAPSWSSGGPGVGA